MNPLPGKSLRAFTLVEMLAVIVILAILAVLVMFGAGRVKVQIGVVKCVANLRQVHAALMQYAGDHDGLLPGPLTSTMTPYFKMNNQGEPTSNQLSGYLAPYLDVAVPAAGQGGVNPHLACPAFWATLSGAERGGTQFLRSYGIPLGGAGWPFGYTTSGDPSKTRPPRTFHAFAAEFPPSKTWILRDTDRGNTSADTNLIPEPIHQSSRNKWVRNYLFADGSVRSLTPDQE